MAQKGMAKSIVILIILAAGITGIFVYKKIDARNSLAAQIAALSPGGAPPQSIEDLQKAVALYERKIEEHVKDAAQTGIYWKILGSRLLDSKNGQKPLYGEALKALENAARYYPNDESIHYLIGISAGNLGQAEYFSPSAQAEYYRIAEVAYLRAINLNGRYARALYGLGVLYVYALGRSADAIPYLELYLDINKRDTDGMFLLASARYLQEDYARAVDLYDQIIGITKNKEIKKQAEQIRQQVMDAWYR
jgi:tetratricopeptide (TPR) repeat protein